MNVPDRGDALGAAHGQPLAWLRVEGAAVFVAALAFYLTLGGWWILLVPLLLLPDVSMLGYLRGPAVGAALYNLAHNWAVALAIVAAGVALESTWLALAGSILVAHVGMDRALGYGLKYATAFHDTHLGRIGPGRRSAEFSLKAG